MAARPAYSSRQSTTTTATTATMSSGSCSLLSSSHTNAMTHSTAPTTPDLGSPTSPKKTWLQGRMEPMLTVLEVNESPELDSAGFKRLSVVNKGGGSRRASAELLRGKSVKDRVGQWETASAGPSTPIKRPLPQPTAATAPRPTSPLRIPSKSPTTPLKPRRIPVPASEPARQASYTLNRVPSPPKSRSPTLTRGTGSAKRMIQQWEHPDGSPTRRTPSSRALQPTKRLYSREYLDAKPLPIPAATPLSTSMLYSPSKASSARSYQSHLTTPTRQATSPSHSPSSPSKKGKGKSPLKDMLDRFGGGIKDVGRKMKGKRDRGYSVGRGATPMQQSREDLHFWEEPKFGSNGLPGGIVFSDRMGDVEMDHSAADVVRASAIVYLVPTPCSSVSPWGSWLTSHASLTSSHLCVTYCPVFSDPKSGQSTPRRVFSGTAPGGTPGVAFASIPSPAPGQEPDVELPMKDCVEIRSLRKDEVKGRGIPPAPEGIGTEVLEMVWSDGRKRYIGVEGVGGRLGWVSAVWDVILASKTGAEPALPPPSPVQLAKNPSLRSDIAPLSSGRPSVSNHEPTPELSAFRSRIASIEARGGDPSVNVPVQKIGDAWMASSVIAVSEPKDEAPLSVPVAQGKRDSAADLRDSVAQMFDTSRPSPNLALALDKYDYGTEPESEQLPLPRRETPMDRVAQWQQPGTHHLSVFGRSRTPTFPPTEVDLHKTDTILSFDPNDLNPSRSASQVRRASTVAPAEPLVPRYRPGEALEAVEEVSDSMTMPPTHVSHVTFPKPAVGGYRMGQPLSPQPEMAESTSLHSTRSTQSGTNLQTPRTAAESFTSASADSHAPNAADEGDGTHGVSLGADGAMISRQVEDVHGDVKKVVGALSALVAASQFDQLHDASRGIDDKLSTLSLDVKAIENALNLSSLAERGPPSLEKEGMDDKVPELHRKLDDIARVCEQLLARGVAPAVGAAKGTGKTPRAIPAVLAAGAGAATGAAIGSTMDSVGMARDASNASNASAKSAKSTGGVSHGMARKGSLGITHDEREEKEAGEEVAAIMAELTGGSSHSVRPGGIQVLHNSAPSSPLSSTGKRVVATPLPEETAKQVGEVLGLVRELKDARALQTQQTSDIARYLNELNSWLEKFVTNSTKELSTLNNRLTAITGPDAPEGAEGDDAPKGPQGLADLVADMHAMATEQKFRAEQEGMVGQRLDMLLTMMGAEQERHAGQQNVVEQVVSMLDRQRHENEVLLRALATDITSEIRGERLRFVEAMQQATTMNINIHVEEFKKALGAEVHKSMAELGRMREEKKALEQNISDLFALKAKHGMASRSNTKKAPSPAPTQAPSVVQSPHAGYAGAAYGRGLPVVPGRH